MSPGVSQYSNRVVVGDGLGDSIRDNNGFSNSNSFGGGGKVASSFPRGGFDLTTAAMNAVSVAGGYFCLFGF